MHTSPAQAWRRFQIRRSAAEMLIIGEKGRSNDIIYRRSYNCGDDRQTGWLGGPDLEVTHTANLYPSNEEGTRYTNVGSGSGDYREGKGPRWSLKSRTNLSPLKLSLSVQVHAAGCWQKPKTGFHKNHGLSPPFLFIYPLSLHPLFSSLSRERDTIVLFLSFSLSLSFVFFFVSFLYRVSRVYVRVHACVIQPAAPRHFDEHSN